MWHKDSIIFIILILLLLVIIVVLWVYIIYKRKQEVEKRNYLKKIELTKEKLVLAKERLKNQID